ncbi:MAG: gliding motility-associated C-terminal domain-containing protein [Bacteroidota bacterium]
MQISTKYSRYLLLILWSTFFLVHGHALFATHNLAGQITLERNDPSNPLSYTITLTTYTDPSEAGVDRCVANFGIFSFDQVTNNFQVVQEIFGVKRMNGPLIPVGTPDCGVDSTNDGVAVRGNVKRNVYKADIIFPNADCYYIHYFDIARLSNIINIQLANDIPFTVVTQLCIPPPIIGTNNTPVLLNEPLFDACIGKPWTHNPGGFDADGDSLVYYMIPSNTYVDGQSFQPLVGINPNPGPILGYSFPDDPLFINGPIEMDSVTGLITWNTPNEAGIYNISYVVEEYRNGNLLGYVQRDMAVFVLDCDNEPPVIETITDTCVTAGDFLEFEFKAWDPDSADEIYLDLNNGPDGNNGPFRVDDPATLSGFIRRPEGDTIVDFTDLPVMSTNDGDGSTPVDTIIGEFNWQTTCDHIRIGFYQVDFFASDDLDRGSFDIGSSTTTLTANKVVQIRVIPPSPEDLFLAKGNRSIELTWLPPDCPDLVRGYFIYRKVDGAAYQQDTVCCEDNPATAGFELIGTNAGLQNINFTDDLLDIDGGFGTEICYAVTAVFGDPLQPTNPDRQIESCAAVSCIEIENQPILLTEASVTFTDSTSGSIDVEWTQPEIDTIFPDPYTYIIYRGDSTSFPDVEIARQPYTDTSFTDVGINTVTQGYSYRIEIHDGGDQPINLNDGDHIGSSIYLRTVGGSPGFIDLTWKEAVPWSNSAYEIYRSDQGFTGLFDADDFVLVETVAGTGDSIHTYRDSLLNPDIEYCYMVRSIGSYGRPDVRDSLRNNSQITCDLARDDEDPCNPDLSVVGDCETKQHIITLTKQDEVCDLDAGLVTLSYALGNSGQFQEILQIPYSNFGRDTTFTIDYSGDPERFTGCYSVATTDTFGVTSRPSSPLCIDFCPDLDLPNVFTPNGDNVNDIWVPKSFSDVVLREVKIYDRWGRLMQVATTGFPNLWDGRHYRTGAQAPAGVYYYYISFDVRRLSGDETIELKGWVTLLL